VIRSWQHGHKPEWIAAEYGIGYSTVKRFITRYKRLGHIRATAQRRASGQFTPELLVVLAEQVRQHHDATVDEHTDLWNQSQALRVSRSTMGRVLLKLGWTRKKRPSGL
jgi:transposase